MSPADQPQAINWRRSTEPPTLWLSLVLGSMLIHLVFFIILSGFLARTAKVQLDPEPIAVEFVDPTATSVQAQSTAPKQAIAARSAQPSVSTPPATPAPTNVPRSQPFDFNRPVEPPLTPPPIVRRKPQPVRPRPQQPQLPTSPIQPQPNLPENLPSQPPSSSNQSQGQPNLNPDPSQGNSPNSAANPGNIAPQPTGTQEPAQGERITQLPQGENVAVAVSNPRQTIDFQKQPARPIELQKNVSIRYPSTLARKTILLQASLYIDQNGSMIDVIDTKLLSPGSAIDQETLNDLAKQIFTQWQFVPAQDAQDGQPLRPSPSNLIIDAQVQLP